MRVRFIRVLVSLFVLFAIVADAQGQRHTEHVVLVTLDGSRWQEIFGGMDRDLMVSNLKNEQIADNATYQKYWAATPAERRLRLLPFFWGTLMRQGTIAGNQALGSIVRVSNGHRFSYPGYAEIMTGSAHDDVINSNASRQNPYETVLEFIRRQKRLSSEKVAVFGSWATIGKISEHEPGSLTTNAGAQALPTTDPQIAQLNTLQAEIPSPWEIIRPDAFTFHLAMFYLKTHRPTVMFLSFDETDDWAHDGKYEWVLESYLRTDRYLEALWQWLQSDAEYKGTTTLVITTDHGRGKTLDDWKGHGAKVEGADDIWLAIVGPDTPALGEWRPRGVVYQNQIAATLAELLGLNFQEHQPTAGSSILPLLR
jgi:hypothetical protein